MDNPKTDSPKDNPIRIRKLHIGACPHRHHLPERANKADLDHSRPICLHARFHRCLQLAPCNDDTVCTFVSIVQSIAVQSFSHHHPLSQIMLC